jgi:hypothetical protein
MIGDSWLKSWIVVVAVKCGAAFATAVLFASCVVQAKELQEPKTCPGPIHILGDIREIDALICDAVAQSRKLLEPCGIVQTQPITFEIVGQMDEKHEACVAYFDCDTDKLTLLAPFALASSGEVISIFRGLSDDEYFSSVIVHETTHALVHQSHDGKFSRVAHEYLAYALQIASLSEEGRFSVLRALQFPETKSLDGVDEIALLFGPSQFAVRSYQHFSRPENGCSFIDCIIDPDPEVPEAFLGNNGN